MAGDRDSEGAAKKTRKSATSCGGSVSSYMLVYTRISRHSLDRTEESAAGGALYTADLAQAPHHMVEAVEARNSEV